MELSQLVAEGFFERDSKLMVHDKYKTRLVAKGFKQKKDSDYFNNFTQSQGLLVLVFLFLGCYT